MQPRTSRRRVLSQAVENLESRFLLACTIVQEGGLLSITGDEKNDLLTIRESAGLVTVFCSDSPAADPPPQEFKNVERINASTGAGDDIVLHLVSGPETRPAAVSLTLGEGRDRASIDGADLGRALWRYSISAGAGNDAVQIHTSEVFGASFGVNLGEGDDTLEANVDIGQPVEPSPAAAFDIDPPAPPNPIPIPFPLTPRLTLEASGGDGNDSLTFNARTTNQPSNIRPRQATLVVHLSGGGGDDAFSTSLANVLLEGTTFLGVRGGAGNDTSKAIVEGATVGKLTHKLDLGAGDDSNLAQYDYGTSLGRVEATIFTGSGNDSSEVDLQFKRAAADVNVNVVTADGADRSKIALDFGSSTARVAVNSQTGGGDDHASLSAHYQSARRASFSLSTGDGADTLEVNIPNPSSSTALRASTGEGADTASLNFVPLSSPIFTTNTSTTDRPSPFPIPIPKPRPDPFPAEASWLSTGSGNDTVKIEASDARVGATLTVELGSGNDALAANLPDSTLPEPAVVFPRFKLKTFAGAGDDRVAITRGHSSFISGSDGNDRIDLSGAIFTQITGGGGNDEIAVEDSIATTIGGDAGDDVVAIADSSASRISTGDGNDDVTVNRGRNINISTGNHDDHVDLNAALDEISIELGTGNDSFDGIHLGSPGPTLGLVAENLILRVFGGLGNDRLSQHIGNPFTDDIGPVYLNGNVNITLDAGAGDDAASLQLHKNTIGGLTAKLLGQDGFDKLTTMSNGLLTGEFNIEVQGGFNDDTIESTHTGQLRDAVLRVKLTGDQPDPRAVVPPRSNDTISAIFRFADESEGTLIASVLGGQDNDILTLKAELPEKGVRHELFLDGGPGIDHCDVTDNVHVVNCEDDPPPPPAA